jgi:hypothetical protein
MLHNPVPEKPAKDCCNPAVASKKLITVSKASRRIYFLSLLIVSLQQPAQRTDPDESSYRKPIVAEKRNTNA